jgi:hypothetical protein
MTTVEGVTIEIGDLGSTGTFTINRDQDDLIHWGVDLHIDTTPLVTLSEIAGSDLFEIFMEMIDYGCVEDIIVSDGIVSAEGEASIGEINHDGGHLTISFQGRGSLDITRHQHNPVPLARQELLQRTHQTMYWAFIENNVPMRG